jgi:LysM repeat protein
LESATGAGKETLGLSDAMDAEGTTAASAGGTTHTVRPGETLYRIGQKYHVAPDQLRKWNNLKDNQLAVGQKLVVTKP